MKDLDIPILQKAYDAYKLFYSFRLTVSKQDRYTLWQRCENLLIEMLEGLLLGSQQSGRTKLPTLEKMSVKLNFLRLLIRLMMDVKAIDNKKYIILEAHVDEIGRMLGGWIKATKEIAETPAHAGVSG